MTDPVLVKQAGARLRKIRLRLGLSIREVERRSLQLAAERQNRDYALSRTWIMYVEKGRFVPGTFKIVSLGLIYQMTIAEIHELFGVKPGDIVKESGLFSPPKTYLLTPPDESQLVPETPSASREARNELENTNILARLVDIWGDVPVPLLRRLALRRSLYGYIGTKDRTMAPLLPPGTFVRIDAKQTHVKNEAVKKEAGRSLYGRPIYFLDIRTGYACGWCQIENGVLTLIPHPDSGVKARTFRYPSEVDIVGRVTGIALGIDEENSAEVDESLRQNPQKK